MIGLELPPEAWEGVDEEVDALLEEWLVEEGTAVESGQALASVTVVKTSYEVVAPTPGTLHSILVKEGDTFSRGTDLGLIAGSEVSDPAAESEAPPQDAAAQSAPADPGPAEEDKIFVPLTGVRGAVARNMAASWQNPRVAAGVQVEMTALLALQARVQEQAGAASKVTPTHLLVRAVALTLAEHPRLNALIEENRVEVVPEISIGLAVSLSEGILVPVLRDVVSKSLTEIASESRALAERARAGESSPGELTGGTFTLSNLGATGIDWFTPIINAPQVAILGVGAIVERPLARDSEVVIAPTMDLTLVYDHRAVDGHPASLMLAALRDRIERADLGLE